MPQRYHGIQALCIRIFHTGKWIRACSEDSLLSYVLSDLRSLDTHQGSLFYSFSIGLSIYHKKLFNIWCTRLADIGCSCKSSIQEGPQCPCHFTIFSLVVFPHLIKSLIHLFYSKSFLVILSSFRFSIKYNEFISFYIFLAVLIIIISLFLLS